MKVSLLFVLAAQFAVSLSCDDQYVECLEYEVLAEHQEYEERKYSATTWVSVTVEGSSLSKAESSVLYQLGRYIQGYNSKNLFINTTMPIRTKIESCRSENCSTKYTISFLIPKGIENDPPAPTDHALFLEKEPPRVYAVRRLNGTFTQTFWESSLEILQRSIENEIVLKQDVSYIARFYYDTVFNYFKRFIEIWIELE
ncbi:heme-binding protein 2-like [Limulus polyphemus]|uniref:Heme-binding protein 2-like n=1 Tax=Limulus polyphemus TaxID=6850 RepID=A0ABM1TST2_LIMPO|nr:heme-binding protein 2-like [Limulus polyphemus]